jgi:oligopeptidase B
MRPTEEAPAPPKAKRVPLEIVTHGDVRVDDYHWMRDRSDPDLLKYIEEENRYTDAMMEATETLQNRLVEEIVARTPEEDESVPRKIDDYIYYEKTVAGRQYPIYCRRRGSMDGEEEVVLDQNAVADGLKFFEMGTVKVSPDHTRVVYLADTNGSERYDLFIRDIASGRLLNSKISDTDSVEWTNDSRAVFYVVLDEVHRPDRVKRHVLGTDSALDETIYQEEDPMYEYLNLRKTKSKTFMLITAQSLTTSEVSYIPAENGNGEVRTMVPRRQGVKYYALHHGDAFYILTNDGAPNYKMVKAPADDCSTERWEEVIPHSERVALCVSDPVPWVEVFERHLVVFDREDGVVGIRVIDLETGEWHRVPLPEKVCSPVPMENTEYDSTSFRFGLSSLTRPNTVYEYDMASRKLEVKKRMEVAGYDPDRYETEKVFATARDGARVSMIMVYRKPLVRDGKRPMLLLGYGAYGDFETAGGDFTIERLSLLDRGVVFAIANIRGGADMGGRWYEDGVMLNKVNSFTDFIACAEHLIAEGYTSKDRLAATGRSAGGLLMGAVVNMRPDLFKAIETGVPFVDVINTQLDPTIPLVPGETEEWGDPTIEEHYWYQKTYSPYDNVEPKDYPSILVTTGMNDPRVPYWEPVKWVARLRANKTDSNPLLLRTRLVQGHRGSSGRYDHARDAAFLMAFILHSLGIDE